MREDAPGTGDHRHLEFDRFLDQKGAGGPQRQAYRNPKPARSALPCAICMAISAAFFCFIVFIQDQQLFAADLQFFQQGAALAVFPRK